MNEILQKRIEESAHQYIQSDAVAPENMTLAFGDFINGTKWALQNQWISVEEALPKFEGNFSEYCIIRTENGFYAVTMYYRTSEKEYWWNFEKVKVTHWMPIPTLKGG